MDNENEKIFDSRDIYLSATLITLRFKLIGIDLQIEGQRNVPVGYFKFADTAELREAERDYWNGNISLEPRAFVTSLRGLKAQLSGAYKSPFSGSQR